MAIFTETVTSYSAVEVYGGLAACKNYLGTSMSDGATAFLGLASDDDRKRALIAATRFIDAQVWQGVAMLVVPPDPTTLQWPRSGITNADGTPVSSTVVPPVLVQAVFELAGIIADDPDVQAAVDASNNIKSVSASGAGVEYFSPTNPLSAPPSTKLPVPVHRLIGKWLATSGAGSSDADGGYAGSGGCSSEFDSCSQYRRSEP